MAPPSKLTVKIQALQRLIKEEASYHKEQGKQEERIKKLEADKSDENAEYLLRQERAGLDETIRLFPHMREKIKVAVTELKAQLESGKADGSAKEDEIKLAEDTIAQV